MSWGSSFSEEGAVHNPSFIGIFFEPPGMIPSLTDLLG
jgi:hypothetical protein